MSQNSNFQDGWGLADKFGVSATAIRDALKKMKITIKKELRYLTSIPKSGKILDTNVVTDTVMIITSSVKKQNSKCYRWTRLFTLGR